MFSEAYLISEDTECLDEVISNPVFSETSTISDNDMEFSSGDLLAEIKKDASVTDITINIPQTTIDAAKDPTVKPVKDKQLEKDLKRQEKLRRKDEKKMSKMKKREKRDHAKKMKLLEKERKKDAKQQDKAQGPEGTEPGPTAKQPAEESMVQPAP